MHGNLYRAVLLDGLVTGVMVTLLLTGIMTLNTTELGVGAIAFALWLIVQVWEAYLVSKESE